MASSSENDDQWRELEAEVKPTAVLPNVSGIDMAQLGPTLGIYGVQPGRGTPDYLFPIQHQRSLFQQLTSNCGLAYGSGLAAGGMIGTVQGLKSKDATNFKLKINAVLNGAGKRGTGLANSFGTIALFYTCFSNGLQAFRDKSDVYNEIGGAVLTGLVYKSTRGIRAATAAGVLAGSALGIVNTIRHHLSKSGHASLSQLLPKFS